MTRLVDWWQAARPLAHFNIAVPLLFGQSLAYAAFRSFSWERFGVLVAFGVLVHLFIIFANDCADIETDSKNQTFNLVSGGSRVIVEGKIAPMTLARAALVCAAALGLGGAAVTLHYQLALALVLVTLPIALTWAYSFRPFRLSYRGRGELLQALGVGGVLPVVGFYIQAGTLTGLNKKALAASLILAWAGNLVTAVPDEPSDKASDKRTYAVRHGGLRARRDALIATALATLLSVWVVPNQDPWIIGATIVPPILAVAYAARQVKPGSADNRPACLRYVVGALAASTCLLLGWSTAGFVG